MNERESGDEETGPRPDIAPAISLRRRVLSLPTLLSFVVAAAFVFFLATRFDLNWGETWQNLRSMDVRFYALALALYYVSFSFRGLRWRLLAKNAGLEDRPDTRLPSAFKCASLIVAGWFVNSIAWLRLGDAYRAYLFSQESRTGFSWSLGTVLAERMMDMATVAAIIAVSVLALALTASVDGGPLTLTLSHAGERGMGSLVFRAAAIAALMTVALAVLVLAMKAFGARLARLLPQRLEAAFLSFRSGAFGSFKRGHVVHLATLFGLGLLGWLMEIARLGFVVQALGAEVGLPMLAIVALAHALLSTVPTPGGVGAVEPGVTGLLALSLARHEAVSIALLDRSITYLSVLVVGGLVLVVRQLASARRKSAQDSPEAASTER